MPQFSYTAKDSSGNIISSSITASNLQEASSILYSQKLQILQLSETSNKQHTAPRFSAKISTIEKANLCHYLSTMIAAGLPLPETINAINQDTKNKSLNNILTDVKNNLQQGKSLSSTFAKYPHVFDQVFITIVASGEQTGSLQKSFKYLQKQLMSSYKLSQQVKSALIYPAVIITTMAIIGIILIVFVIPQIAQVFLKTSLPIPKTTIAILKGGLTIKQNLAYISVGLFISSIITIIAFNTYKGKKMLSNFIKQIPGVRKLFEKLDLSRFTRTLATLLQSGVPITKSLEIATITLTQKKYSQLITNLHTNIKKGESITSVFRNQNKHIPQMMIRMIATGEKTGTLDKILFDLTKFYEQELEKDIKNFTAALEPVIMIFIGIGVGGMVLSIIAPIYSLVSSLQQL